MADEWKMRGGLIRLLIGDILDLEVEAIVYYARPDLALGSGFGAAIAARGGPRIQEELKKLAPLPVMGTAVTSGGDLKAKYIIHAVGPRFQEEDLEEKLRKTMGNVLQKAEAAGIRSMAFPAMGAGFYGVPLEVCAQITLGAVREYLKKEARLQEAVFCLRDSREYEPFQTEMKKMK